MFTLTWSTIGNFIWQYWGTWRLSSKQYAIQAPVKTIAQEINLGQVISPEMPRLVSRERERGREKKEEGRGEREQRREKEWGGGGMGVDWQGEEGGEGRKGQRERARKREKTGTGKQTDRPTRMKTWISPRGGGNNDNYDIITLLSYQYPDRNVPHPPYILLWSHRSLID